MLNFPGLENIPRDEWFSYIRAQQLLNELRTDLKSYMNMSQDDLRRKMKKYHDTFTTINNFKDRYSI